MKGLLRDLQNGAPLLRIPVEHAERGKQAGGGHPNGTAMPVPLDHSDPEAVIPVLRSLLDYYEWEWNLPDKAVVKSGCN